jgi:hypothetical protein
MTIIEYTISTEGKCVSCVFYDCKDDSWLSGKCLCTTNKVKNKNRYYNSKACMGYRR